MKNHPHPIFYVICSLLFCFAITSTSGCGSIRSKNLPNHPNPHFTGPIIDNTQAADYKISPGDTITVTVYRDPDLQDVVKNVSESGEINLLYCGKIKVAGLTVSECIEKIEERLKEGKFFKDPVVDVSVMEFDVKLVFVTGEVNTPGTIKLSRGEQITITEAVARAGGFTKNANKNKVHLIRKNGEKNIVQRIRVKEIIKGKIPDVVLKDGDTIDVKESFFGG